MNRLPILQFEPILKSVVWGGRKMEVLLQRKLPESVPYGESWELVDLDGHQSIVSDGIFAGSPLEQLVSAHRDSLLGEATLLDGRFPLLFKFIDAQDTLSVQVHPDAEACMSLGGGARPKTEAWYIIACEPNSELYVGLRQGVTAVDFSNALAKGTVAELLYKKEICPGDYVFLPSGTVHAIGSGIVLAEVQQSSTTTYRVFDWNRVGLDGNPRELHIHNAMAAIHFGEFEEPGIISPKSGRKGVSCEYFSMETVNLFQDSDVQFSHAGPIVVMQTAGQGTIQLQANNASSFVRLGKTALVPACIASDLHILSDGDAQCIVTLIH